MHIDSRENSLTCPANRVSTAGRTRAARCSRRPRSETMPGPPQHLPSSMMTATTRSTSLEVGMTPAKTARPVYLHTFCLAQPWLDSKSSKTASRASGVKKNCLSTFFGEASLTRPLDKAIRLRICDAAAGRLSGVSHVSLRPSLSAQ